jgi:hypothetical protein
MTLDFFAYQDDRKRRAERDDRMRRERGGNTSGWAQLRLREKYWDRAYDSYSDEDHALMALSRGDLLRWYSGADVELGGRQRELFVFTGDSPFPFLVYARDIREAAVIAGGCPIDGRPWTPIWSADALEWVVYEDAADTGIVAREWLAIQDAMKFTRDRRAAQAKQAMRELPDEKEGAK